MKKTGCVLAALALLISLVGFCCTGCAKRTNPHAAEWLDETMTASLDSLRRVDEAGVFYEMTCDYDYYGNPIFKTLLSKLGQYDAGCSAFTTWNETGDCFLTARNCDYRHIDSNGAYTGLNVALHCAPVEEAVALAQEYNIRNLGGIDLHLFVTDATGASVVLEWRYNQLTVTDTNAVTNFYVGFDDAEDRYKDGVCTEKAVKLENTVREYHYGYGHGYHRLNGIVSALERYIDFSTESCVPKMTQTQAMRILSVAAQDPGTEATSMTQYSVIYNAQEASATVWLQQDYDTAYHLAVE